MRAGLRLAAISLLFLATGCTQLGPAERQSLIQAAQQYEKNDLPGATDRLDRLIRDFDRAPEIAEAYYLRGLCRLRSGQTAQAAADFQVAIDRSSREDLTARAKVSLASIAAQNGEWHRAATLYEQGVGALPDQPPTDQILYEAGVAMQRAGRWKAAAFQFSRILSRFPNRPVAVEAGRMAAWRHDYFAIQLAVFSNSDAAARAVGEFRSRGLDAVQENLPRAGGAMWVVMAGRYPTFADAVAALPRAKQHEPSAFIIP